MCQRCSLQSQKVWTFGCAGFIVVIAVLILSIWPIMLNHVMDQEFRFEENSTLYNNWVVTPVPMYLSITFFNWSNSDDILNLNVRPIFHEMGPYVFKEVNRKVDLEWGENFTLGYNQERVWYFVEELSNGSLDDEVTNLNVISASAVYSVRAWSTAFLEILSWLMTEYEGTLFTTRTVRELLFEGYDDPFLVATEDMMEILEFDTPLGTRFGWFMDRNGSTNNDGRFTINTGAENVSHLGKLLTWNNESMTSFYSDECSRVKGSTGELFPRKMNPNAPIEIFSQDLCRSMRLTYDSEYNNQGVKAGKWVGDESVFDNGEKYPENTCFCTSDECDDVKTGVFNVSDCKLGAPAFVSFPHFYLADPSFVEDIDGMNPTKDEHEFYLVIDPLNGLPIEVRARSQINILLQPMQDIAIYKDVPKLMVPMFWFSQNVELTDDLATEVRFLQMLPSLGIWVAYGLAGVAALIILFGAWLCLRNANG